jgi:hypothetical protein
MSTGFVHLFIGFEASAEQSKIQSNTIDIHYQELTRQWIEDNNLHFKNDKYLTPEQRLELARAQMDEADYYKVYNEYQDIKRNWGSDIADADKAAKAYNISYVVQSMLIIFVGGFGTLIAGLYIISRGKNL